VIFHDTLLHHAKAQGGGLEPFGFMNADVGKGLPGTEPLSGFARFSAIV